MVPIIKKNTVNQKYHVCMTIDLEYQVGEPPPNKNQIWDTIERSRETVIQTFCYLVHPNHNITKASYHINYYITKNK